MPDYNSTIEQQKANPVTQWLQDFSGDFVTGAALDYAGQGVSKIPRMGWLGNLMSSWGKFDKIYAAPDATLNAMNNAYGAANKPAPRTLGGHADKWVKNTGTEVAVGTGMMALGTLLSAIPHPAGAVTGRVRTGLSKAGPAVTSAGKLVRNYAWLNSSFGTAADVLGNKLQDRADARQQQIQTAQQANQAANRQQRISGMLGAGIAGTAGLAGASMLINAIPMLRRRKALKYLAYALAAGGAGYAGWRYTNNSMNNFRNTIS